MSNQNWQTMDAAARSAAYNNGAAVANSAAQLMRWRALSAAFRATARGEIDLRYGPRPRNRLDIFPAERPDAPLLVFIHGGYWVRNSKDDFACMAQGPLQRGLAVANVGYTLAPEATLATIVEEIKAALEFLRTRYEGDRIHRRLIVSGWSAGGHLAALASTWPSVGGTLAISGIFDLAPLVGTTQGEPLGLSPTDVEALSPIRHAGLPRGPTVIVFGQHELPELCRQSRDYHDALEAHRRPTTLLSLAGADHFSVLDGLLDPAGHLTNAAVELAFA